MFSAKNYETDWDLICGRRKVRVHVTGIVPSRDCESVAALVVRGHKKPDADIPQMAMTISPS
jgi:hypothetical protein